MSLKALGKFSLPVLIALVLAACGGGDDEERPPSATPPPAGPTAVISPQPVTPGPTATPIVQAAEPLFEEAARQATVALAERLNISIAEVKILDPDTALALSTPLDCPAVPVEGALIYYVYAQYERFIYPFQFYTSADNPEPRVEGCGDVLVDDEVLYVPTANAMAAVLEQVKAALFARGIDIERGTFEVVRPMTWMDTALGCLYAAAATPAPATIEGFLVVYVLDSARYEFHTNQAGDQVILCTAPPGAESLEVLLAQLQSIEDLTVEIAPDEAAIYAGLDRQGTLALLSDDRYRVGLFDFESSEAARAAAQQVDDDRVSHLFVTGRILVVQEENSPLVYSTLLGVAEEVRTPIIEREQAAEEATPEE